jgi:phosphoglycolate phosphatase-like HAD superfamily hydrolase
LIFRFSFFSWAGCFLLLFFPHSTPLSSQNQQLVRRFGAVRDEWMARDLDGWLGSNSFYPGAPAALRSLQAAGEAFIVTTKQARFTAALLAGDQAGVPFPDDRIFSQTVSGEPKAKVLGRLQAAHPGAPSFHFVEDKLATLEAVALDPALSDWQLYLVDWGYNTPAERARAAGRGDGRIRVIGMDEFAGLGQ